MAATGSKRDKLKERMKDSLGLSLVSPPEPQQPQHRAPGDDPGEMRLEVSTAVPMVRALALGEVEPDPDQPRKSFDEAELQQLADSIVAQGQLEPATVYWHAEAGKFRLIFGERRWRACKLAGVPTLAAQIVPEPAWETTRVRQIIENRQRAQVNAIEEAAAFSEVLFRTGWKPSRLAKETGVPQSTITRLTALLDLPMQVQTWVRDGELSWTAAYQITRLPSAADQLDLAHRAVNEQLSRDDVEGLVKRANSIAKDQTNMSPALPEMKRFALRYEGAAEVSCYISAVSLDAAKAYVKFAVPDECKYSLSPTTATPEREIIELTVLTPAHEKAIEYLESYSADKDEAIWDLTSYRAIKRWLERSGRVPSWDGFCEFNVTMMNSRGISHPVRVVSERHDERSANMHFYGPIGRTGERSVYLHDDDINQMPIEAYARTRLAEEFANVEKQFAKDWQRRATGSLQWATGLQRFKPPGEPLVEMLDDEVRAKTSREQDDDWYEDDAAEDAFATKYQDQFGQFQPGPEDAEKLSRENSALPAAFQGWNLDDKSYLSGNVFVDPDRTNPSWADVAAQLHAIAHQAAFLASVDKIKRPAGRTVLPGDFVRFFGSAAVWQVADYEPGSDVGYVWLDRVSGETTQDRVGVDDDFELLEWVDPTEAAAASADASETKPVADASPAGGGKPKRGRKQA